MITQLEEKIERNENRISELKQEILEAEKRKAQIESRLMDIQRGTDGQSIDSEIERRLQEIKTLQGKG
jgi:predicted RNase H-like nuclease (RuvC/YqgF family)